MPEDRTVRIKVVPSDIQARRDWVDEDWGKAEATIQLSGPGYGEAYNWLHVSDEIIRRWHAATGAYLAKKAHSAR